MIENIKTIELPIESIVVAVKKHITLRLRRELQNVAVENMKFDKMGKPIMDNGTVAIEIQKKVFKKTVEIFVISIDGMEAKEFEEKKGMDFATFISDELVEPDSDLILKEILPEPDEKEGLEKDGVAISQA